MAYNIKTDSRLDIDFDIIIKPGTDTLKAAIDDGHEVIGLSPGTYNETTTIVPVQGAHLELYGITGNRDDVVINSTAATTFINFSTNADLGTVYSPQAADWIYDDTTTGISVLTGNFTTMNGVWDAGDIIDVWPSTGHAGTRNVFSDYEILEITNTKIIVDKPIDFIKSNIAIPTASYIRFFKDPATYHEIKFNSVSITRLISNSFITPSNSAILHVYMDNCSYIEDIAFFNNDDWIGRFELINTYFKSDSDYTGGGSSWTIMPSVIKNCVIDTMYFDEYGTHGLKQGDEFIFENSLFIDSFIGFSAIGTTYDYHNILNGRKITNCDFRLSTIDTKTTAHLGPYYKVRKFSNCTGNVYGQWASSYYKINADVINGKHDSDNITVSTLQELEYVMNVIKPNHILLKNGTYDLNDLLDDTLITIYDGLTLEGENCPTNKDSDDGVLLIQNSTADSVMYDGASTTVVNISGTIPTGSMTVTLTVPASVTKGQLMKISSQLYEITETTVSSTTVTLNEPLVTDGGGQAIILNGYMRNVKIENIGVSLDGNDNGIKLTTGQKNVTIKNITAFANATSLGSAVYTWYTFHGTVENIIADNCASIVELDNSAYVDVKNMSTTELVDTADPQGSVYIYYVRNCTISNFSGGYFGPDHCHNTKFSNGVIWGTGQEVWLDTSYNTSFDNVRFLLNFASGAGEGSEISFNNCVFDPGYSNHTYLTTDIDDMPTNASFTNCRFVPDDTTNAYILSGTTYAGEHTFSFVNCSYDSLTITDSESPYEMVRAPQINKFLCDVSTASLDINLPKATACKGRTFEFKDTGGATGVKTIDLIQNGSEEIDGDTAKKTITTAYESISLYSDGTQWFII